MLQRRDLVDFYEMRDGMIESGSSKADADIATMRFMAARYTDYLTVAESLAEQFKQRVAEDLFPAEAALSVQDDVVKFFYNKGLADAYGDMYVCIKILEFMRGGMDDQAILILAGRLKQQTRQIRKPRARKAKAERTSAI